MEIDHSGHLQMKAGSTIVRDSQPSEEAKEARGKLSALAAGLGVCSDVAPEHILPRIVDAEVKGVLRERNRALSSFFLEDQQGEDATVQALVGKHITVVDGEDDFSHTLAHMARRMGAKAEVVRPSTFSVESDQSDIVVGPGPGDPNDMNDPTMRKLAAILTDLEKSRRPFLAVCLEAQILSKLLGMDVVKKDNPAQGVCNEWASTAPSLTVRSHS